MHHLYYKNWGSFYSTPPQPPYVQVCMQLQKLAKIGEIAKFAEMNFPTVRRGRRVLSKNFYFFNTCKKLKKLQNLLKLLNSCVRGGRRVPDKNCDFSNMTKNCEKLQVTDLRFFAVFATGFQKIANLAIFAIFHKHMKNRSFCSCVQTWI